MGTKITALPPVITPVGTDELPISQDTGSGSRITYKATLDQLKNYVGNGTGSVTNIGVNSPDTSIEVYGSPITSSGTISLTINSVALDKLDDGGAADGEVLTYNASTNEWEPSIAGSSGSSGIRPNILVGDGGTTYTLTDFTNDIASNYLVFVGGVAQRPTTDFTISGSSIIFGSSIASGVQILVYAVINIVSLNLDSTPIGTVSWFAASAAPTSYLECSGGVVAISEYLDLYNVIGKKYNTGGEGASNFRLPDLRGEFVRGWDHGRGVDTGRVFGSNQADMFKAHKHTISVRPSVESGGSENPPIDSTGGVAEYDSSTVGGTETRPRNVALLPCIKAVKTVTGNVNTLNFIEKPAGPTNGQVLTYNGSTATWEANTNKLYHTSTDYFIIAYNGSSAGVLNDNYGDGTWRDIKTLTKSTWSTYFGSKNPKNITVAVYGNEVSVDSTAGSSMNFVTYAGIEYTTIAGNKYHVDNLSYAGDNATSYTVRKIYFNENGTAHIRYTKTDAPSWFTYMVLLETEF